MIDPVKKFSRTKKAEHGQGLTEMAILIPFLLILLLGAIEIAQAFVAYIGLVNAAREGAIYASLHPELSTEPDMYDSACENCTTYVDRVKTEIIAVGLDTDFMTTLAPPTAPTIGINCEIRVTVGYQLTTFSSGISLPLVGRFGLPPTYNLRYEFAMPIREANTVCP